MLNNCVLRSTRILNQLQSNRAMSTTAVPTIDIKIVSDTICPWCYIGKRRLEQAIKQIPANSANFNITFQPFLLDPTLDRSAPSENKRMRYQKKFGARTDGLIANMIETGKQCGINFSWDGLIGSTVNSHRLIEYSNQFNKQNQLVNKLFAAYFEHAQDINDKKVLLDVAVDAGLDRQATEKFLNSDEYTDIIQQKVNENVQLGVTGVPFIIIDNKYAISGAQEPAVFIQVFKKLGVNVDSANGNTAEAADAPTC